MVKNRSPFQLCFVYLLLFSLFVCLFSCTNKQPLKEESPLLDSLKERCYAFVMKLQVDSLRTAAEEYIKASPEGSRHFFKAQQFYINSYFNAREYDKVLTLLDKTEQMAHFNEYPSIVCDYMYTRARALQYSKRYSEAIEAFKYCLTFTPKEEQQEEILSTVLATMTQLMNVYIISNQVEDGYRYFRQLKNSPPPVIRRFVVRDLCTHLAYLTYQTGQRDEACRVVDSIFVHPPHNSTSERLFLDYSTAALVYYNHSAMVERVTQWLEQALEEADKYAYTSGVQWSVDMLAVLYWRSNKMAEGAELQFKALRMSQKRGDKGAESACYCSLSNLYRQWELYERADEYADQAIAVILSSDYLKFQGEAFRVKAAVKKVLSQPDSALYYYQKSLDCFEKAQQPVYTWNSKSDLGGVLIDNYEGDSLAMGVNLMREVLKDVSLSENMNYQYYQLGKGLIKQGHNREGELMLDSMYEQMSRAKEIAYWEGMLEYVLDYYLAQDNPAKVMQYTPLYRKQMTERFDEKISRKVTSAMVQYQTEKKEQQLKLTTAELAVKDLRIQLYTIALVLLVFIFIGGVLWYLHKRKLQKNIQLLTEQEKLLAQRDRELAESRLHEKEILLVGALDNLREANNQSEQMREQLDDFLASLENQQSILSVTPSLLREQGEIKFRRYFTQLYPAFLPSLKEYVPDITRGEELLSMLIALNQNMDEVADILCIERKSVKMSRYRLRKKIRIEPEIALDDFVKSLL